MSDLSSLAMLRHEFLCSVLPTLHRLSALSCPSGGTTPVQATVHTERPAGLLALPSLPLGSHVGVGTTSGFWMELLILLNLSMSCFALMSRSLAGELLRIVSAFKASPLTPLLGATSEGFSVSTWIDIKLLCDNCLLDMETGFLNLIARWGGLTGIIGF